jgi:hypothetical protein
VRDAGVAAGGEVAGRVHVPEVLAAVAPRRSRARGARRVVTLPEVELLAVALEGDLDQVRHAENLNCGDSRLATRAS